MKPGKSLLIGMLLPLVLMFSLCSPGMAASGTPVSGGAASTMLGTDAIASGNYDRAIQHLKNAVELLAAEGNAHARIDALSLLGETYRRLGLDLYAIRSLEEALATAKSVKDTRRSASILSSLALLHARQSSTFTAKPAGTTLPTTRGGRTSSRNLSSHYLNEALELAKTSGDNFLLASVYNDRGAMLAARNNFGDSVPAYREAMKLAGQSGYTKLEADATAGYAAAAARLNDYSTAEKYADAAHALYKKPGSENEITGGLLTVGQIFRQLAATAAGRSEFYRKKAFQIFAETAHLAERSKDYRTFSYALGYVGQLKEDHKELESALHYTRRALFAAQQANALELLSAWQWQVGRILRAQGNREGSLEAYRQAATNLMSVKQNMYAGCSSTSLTYKDNIEPVYKELTDLLLQKASAAKDVKEADLLLLEARQSVETMKAAEMQDYFKNSCLEEKQATTRSVETLSARTAVIYIISLPERIELLVSLPDGAKRFTVPNPGNSISSDAKAFRRFITILTDEYMAYSRRLYDALLKPLEADLQRHGITTLVVIPDGVFRAIPFAALHDGTDFVIAKYAVSTSLGLQLLDRPPLKEKKASLLAAGISESVLDYSALPAVATEVNALKSMFEGEVLLNKEFSSASLKNKVEKRNFSYLHLASHGEFSGDAESSFIVAWDGHLTIDQLGRLIKVTRYKDEPLDLITLSACSTAVGDDRAVLGLAGVAIKSGALSALATLWEVDDKTTSELIVDFYRNLKTTTLTKAQALQNAQVFKLKTERHPYYWSPFLLIGNWL
ncbi:MAG TPA: CHAT domain-containing protein [Desulfuromonadales bacterium]|nr:CHAT domain-containing protein [Desulfuromonadales bacterium]